MFDLSKDHPPVIEPVDSVQRRPVWREVAWLLAIGLELLVLLCAAEWVFRWLQGPGWWTESVLGPKRCVRYPFETPAWLVTFRCYLQGTFQERSPSWGPVAVAGLFASLHLFQGWLPVLAFHLPGALIFAAIYRGSRCIVALIIMHLLFDLEAFWLLRTVHLSPDWGVWLPLAGVVVGAVWLVLERRTLVEIAKELGRILRGLTDRWWLWIPGFVALIGGVEWASNGFIVAGARKVIYEDSTIALLLGGGLVPLVLLRAVIGRGSSVSDARR